MRYFIEHRRRKMLILLALVSAITFIPFIGSVHLFDWDEINFAEAAREMLITGNYGHVQINFEPFWEKPPLFLWMQALSMKLFGINEFAARLPNAVCGIFTMLFIYLIGERHFSNRMGLAWVMLYAASYLPHFYFRSGIIDPFFNLFIFSSLYFWFRSLYSIPSERMKFYSASVLLISLAVITKGPAALLIYFACISIYWAIGGFKGFPNFKDVFFFLLILFFVGGLWFIKEILSGRVDVIKDFIVYQIRLLQTEDAGHGGPFYYHFIVVLLGCFPASIFFFTGIRKMGEAGNTEKALKQLMLTLLVVVLVVFSIVKTKIVHYSSLSYLPLTFFGAIGLIKLGSEKIRWPKWKKVLFLVVGSVPVLLALLLPLAGMYTQQIIESDVINDPLTIAALDANVDWHFYHFFPGIMLLLALLVLGFARHRDYSLFFGLILQLIGVSSLIILIVPQIEPYSQGAAIEFYKEKAQEYAIVETYGFKSYAHLYYAQRPKPDYVGQYNKSYMLSENNTVKLYVVCKLNKKEEFANKYPHFNLLYEKNGFAFFRKV